MTSTDKLTIEIEGTQAQAFELTLNTFCAWLVEYQKQTGKSPAEITMGLSILANNLDLTLKMATTLGLGIINNKLMKDGVINDKDIFAALGIEDPAAGGGSADAGQDEGSPTDAGSTDDGDSGVGDVTVTPESGSASGSLPLESD